MNKNIDTLPITPISIDFQGKRKKNLEREVERIAIYNIEDVMEFLVPNFKKPNSDKSRKSIYNILGYQVSVSSLKLRTFFNYMNNLSCSNEGCDLKPAYFALEKMRSSKSPNRAYLSLYALDKEGVEVEFTHDHTLARCFGGANSLANTTPMCVTCNHKKSQIESQTHNQTLMILKQHIKQSTGQDVNLKYALQRVKNLDATPTIDMEYEKVGKISLEAGIEAIRLANNEKNKGGVHTSAEFLGIRLNLKGSRLKTFAKNDIPHCQDENCKNEATHFEIERLTKVGGKVLNDHLLNYQLNLYGLDANGKSITFSHHHSISTDDTGFPYIKDTITLCEDCKSKHNQNNHQHLANSLIEYGGVHRTQLGIPLPEKKKRKPKHVNIPKKKKILNKEGRESNLPQPKPLPGEERWREKIRNMAKEMANYYNMELTSFLDYCQKEGNLKAFEGEYNKIKLSSGHKRAIKEFGFNRDGSIFFRRAFAKMRQEQIIKGEINFRENYKDNIDEKNLSLINDYNIEKIIDDRALSKNNSSDVVSTNNINDINKNYFDNTNNTNNKNFNQHNSKDLKELEDNNNYPNINTQNISDRINKRVEQDKSRIKLSGLK